MTVSKISELLLYFGYFSLAISPFECLIYCWARRDLSDCAISCKSGVDFFWPFLWNTLLWIDHFKTWLPKTSASVATGCSVTIFSSIFHIKTRSKICSMHSENLSVKNKRTPMRKFKTIFFHFQKTDFQRSGVGLSWSKLRQIPFFEIFVFLGFL